MSSRVRIRFNREGSAAVNGARLVPSWARIFVAMLGRPLVTHAFLAEVVWPSAAHMPDGWMSVLGRHIHFLRKAGCNIVNRPGVGFELGEPIWHERGRVGGAA